MKFQKGSSSNNLTYPFTQEFVDNLDPCDLVNPKVGNNYGLRVPEDFDMLVAAEEILKVRLEVLNGMYPEWFMLKYWPYNFEMPTHLPKALEIAGLCFDRPEELADVVHMDDPLDLPLYIKKALTNPKYGGTANIKDWHPRHKQFLETVVDLNETITDYQKKYAHKVFEVKYYFGLSRPEEVLFKLEALLTAYPEGCPTHPSIGQGHEALAQSGIKALHKKLNLNAAQIQDMLYTAYLWGQFRCLAGVHYGIDAIMSIVLVGGFEEYITREVMEAYTITQ